MAYHEGARVNPEWLEAIPGEPVSTSDQNKTAFAVVSNLAVQDSPCRIMKFKSWCCGAHLHRNRNRWFRLPRKLSWRDLLHESSSALLEVSRHRRSAHDKTATAPNFVLAGGRLRQAWVERWVAIPRRLFPGTAMPSGLFNSIRRPMDIQRQDFSAFDNYHGDHANLMVHLPSWRCSSGRAAAWRRTSSVISNRRQDLKPLQYWH